jgi:uncharacterized protein (TIGR02996 family)
VETNRELEQAIENNLDDTAARSVYADWLQSKGDPRGELMALALAGKTAEADAFIAKNAATFLGGLAEHQKTYDGEDAQVFTWKYGFIHGARLSHNHYATKFAGKLADVLQMLLAHPSGRFLEELTLTFNNDPNEDNLQSLIDVLAEVQRPTLRKLHLGDFKYAGAAREQDRGEETEISWYSIGNLSNLWAATPRLQTLIIQTGSAESAMSGGTTLGTLDLPALRHFEYRTGGLEQSNGQSIGEAKAPQLEYLDVWFGQENYGGNCTAEDVQRILSRDFPKLSHLGIMNCEFVEEVIEALAKSKLTSQLKSLDLSLGCLGDEGAEAIAKHKDAFRNLARLDVSQNYLTSDGVAMLRGVVKELVADEQRSAEDDRYAAVGE